MLRAKEGKYSGTMFITSLVWHGPDQGLNLGPPALESSTVPLSTSKPTLKSLYFVGHHFFFDLNRSPKQWKHVNKS